MKSQLVGDGYDLVLWYAQRRAVIPVVGIGERDNRVHAIVSTGQRYNCQDGVFYR